MTSFALHPADTALLVIDMQERFLAAIPDLAEDQSCGRNGRILVEGMRQVGVPILISEQYPKGLGRTVPFIAAAAVGATVAEKSHFSCCDDQALAQTIEGLGRRTIVVCGVEAHVCVLSTTADLVTRGYHVVVAGDAVASRKAEHRDMALTAMRDLGVLVVPVETVLFRLLRQAGTPAFKAISGLVK